MGLKSFIYKITGQKANYEQQLAIDRADIFNDAKMRIFNLDNGAPANSHHSSLRQAVTALSDGNAGFVFSHATFLTGTGLAVATLAGIAAPPLGFAVLGVSAAGFIFDRFTGNHDARKGLRDIERFLKLLRVTEQEVINKLSRQGIHLTKEQQIDSDPTITRIRATKQKLLNEYIERFSAHEKVPPNELHEFIIKNKTIQSLLPSEDSQITSKIMSKVVDKTPGAASQSLKLANLQYASQIAGSVSAAAYIVTGGARRLYQIAGRSSWDIRISNATFARDVLACVDEATKTHCISLHAHQKDIDKVNGQASKPEKYISEWKKTSNALALTTSHISELRKLIKDVAGSKAPALKLSQALKGIAEDHRFFKSPMVLGTDRLKFWQKNPIKELAEALTKLGNTTINPKDLQNSLNKLNALLNDVETKIKEAATRNDKLVGTEYSQKHKSGMAPSTTSPQSTKTRQTPELTKKPSSLLSKAKIAASGALSGAGATILMPELIADTMGFVMDFAADMSPAMAITTVAAATGIAIRTLRKADRNEVDEIRKSLSEQTPPSGAVGNFTKAELERRGAKDSRIVGTSR